MSSWADTVEEELKPRAASSTSTEAAQSNASAAAAALTDDGESQPKPLSDGPPPGFEDVATKLEESTVKEEDDGTVDAPDIALKVQDRSCNALAAQIFGTQDLLGVDCCRIKVLFVAA